MAETFAGGRACLRLPWLVVTVILGVVGLAVLGLHTQLLLTVHTAHTSPEHVSTHKSVRMCKRALPSLQQLPLAAQVPPANSTERRTMEALLQDMAAQQLRLKQQQADLEKQQQEMKEKIQQQSQQVALLPAAGPDRQQQVVNQQQQQQQQHQH